MTYLTTEQTSKIRLQAGFLVAERDGEQKYNALCNAAIAHYLSQMGEGLPEPTGYMEYPIDEAGYTREQMIAWGAAQREKALEEAAIWLDFYDGAGMRRAEAIRALKGKQ